YNLYGPTEDTVWTTWAEVGPAGEEENRGLPVIGKPVANHKVYILDANQTLQPPGIAGELCIAGSGLAEGYLNNPELTAERFVNYKAPAGHPPGITNEKQETIEEKGITNREKTSSIQHPASSIQLYRTGDLASWLQDGNIEFLGRIDHQVKIRGYRIELGEIETHLLKHPEIKEAIVLARESKNNENYLCAYYVVESNPPPESGIQL
ncbi:MAG: amino acid adenylation domain-containing protein, partial [bacterium]|nr:amino acid adenylation domain-containing protein [bacterium]